MAIDRKLVSDLADTTHPVDVGHVVARIDGALGSTIIVGLDRLNVLRGSGSLRGLADVPREPWSYGDLAGVTIGHYGSMPVVLLHLSRRDDPLPILILERGQVGPALDGLVTLRRLIAAASHTLTA
jgi:hypothetical protein